MQAKSVDVTNSSAKKLRILCLHGYNNTSEIMMFQMQNFINTFGELCEFYYLDGPRACTAEEPIPYFVKKGIKPPYKIWNRLMYEPTRTLPDGSQELAITKC